MTKCNGSLVYFFIFVIAEICEILYALAVSVVPGHCPKLTDIRTRKINCDIVEYLFGDCNDWCYG
jgi:hypothetical protein